MAQLIQESRNGNTPNAPATPKWMSEFQTLFLSGVSHAFIFHFNTRDYMARNLTLREYLAKAMPNKRVIAFYNLAEGITFARPAMRMAFDEICELTAREDPAQGGDPSANILSSLGLGATPTQAATPNAGSPAMTREAIGKALPEWIATKTTSKVTATWRGGDHWEFELNGTLFYVYEGGRVEANNRMRSDADALAAELKQYLKSVLDAEPLPRSPDKAIPLLEKLLRKGARVEEDNLVGEVVVVIEFAETVCPNADVSIMDAANRATLVTLQRLGADQDLARKGNPLILVTENLIDLHPALRRASAKYEAIEIALPNFDERKRFIQQLLERREETLATGLTVDMLAASTAMLNRMHIEDIFLRASEDTGVVTPDLVRERKRAIIAAEFGEVIEVMEPAFTFEDIGGLQHVKEFFMRSVIKPMKEGRYGRVPMGVLMPGPAGTGKSVMAQAVAYESGMNCVILNPAKLFGQYVGNTERNLDKALRAIVSMAPTIVFLDEIDQTVSRGGGGDSGVSNRFFKRLLEFMSDTTHRGRVVFLAATNRPDLMDAALRRPGRFDRKIPFLIPNADERMDIVRVMARRYALGAFEIQPGETVLPALTLALETEQELRERTEKWTGAEIEAAVIKAYELVEDDALSVETALLEAVKRLRPSTADIEFQTLLALNECNDTDLLPPQYREELQDRRALQQQIETLAPRERARREM